MGMWGCDRFLGCGGVRSLFSGCGSAIAFGMWGCDRCFGMLGVRSLFGDVGMRSLFGDVWGAIAQALTCQFACWECGESDRCLGMCGSAIAQALTCQFAFGGVGSTIAVWGCGEVRSLFRECWEVRSLFGMWGERSLFGDVMR
ncbi:MAG: hypothetical protein HEQ33_07590 [Dolichospermum sp. WA123]|nr:hypothetical protein [Dolichospermum sp. WA123]